jgi:hypothetical protein
MTNPITYAPAHQDDSIATFFQAAAISLAGVLALLTVASTL